MLASIVFAVSAAASTPPSQSLESQASADSACSWFGASGQASSVAATDMSVWFADPMVKLFPSSLPPASLPPAPAPVLCAARGEVQPFQLAVRPTAALSGLRLIAKATGPARAPMVARVVNVNVSVPINKANRTGSYPDALPPIGNSTVLSLPAGVTAVFWVSVASLEVNTGSFTVEVYFLTKDEQQIPLGTVHVRIRNPTVNSFGDSLLFTLSKPMQVVVHAFSIPPSSASSFLADAGLQFAPFFEFAKTPPDAAARTAVVKGVYQQVRSAAAV